MSAVNDGGRVLQVQAEQAVLSGGGLNAILVLPRASHCRAGSKA
jgi:hypothetical protein